LILSNLLVSVPLVPLLVECSLLVHLLVVVVVRSLLGMHLLLMVRLPVFVVVLPVPANCSGLDRLQLFQLQLSDDVLKPLLWLVICNAVEIGRRRVMKAWICQCFAEL
jgi:hypothetical protein